MKNCFLKIFICALVSGMFHSCATYTEQIGKEFKKTAPLHVNELQHEIIAIGNLNFNDNNTFPVVTTAIKDYLTKYKNEQTLLFLGDYEKIEPNNPWLNLTRSTNGKTFFFTWKSRLV